MLQGPHPPRHGLLGNLPDGGTKGLHHSGCQGDLLVCQPPINSFLLGQVQLLSASCWRRQQEAILRGMADPESRAYAPAYAKTVQEQKDAEKKKKEAEAKRLAAGG